MTSRRGGNLSGGQQQQLAIGRALASNPTVLLPNDIFDWDLMPDAHGPTKYLDGSVDMTIAHDL